MSSTGACCARIFLGLLNTIFLLVGLLLMVVGALIKSGANFIAEVLDALKDIPTVSQYVETAAWVLIGIGIFLTLMGILGGCGACCSVKVFLVAYAVIVIVLVLVEIVFVALLFSKALRDILSDSLEKVFDKYNPPNYSGTFDSTDAISRALDIMFIELKCCGFNDYTDIKNNYNSDTIPITCCKGFDKDLVTAANLNLATSLKTCAKTGTNSYKDTGCYQALLDQINNPVVISIITAILLFQVVCIVFAIIIVRDKNKNQVSPMD